MFHPNNISKTEQQFIRTYVAAMKRDYYMIWSVLDLMHPEHLGVKEIVTAARLARELQQLQADFDDELLALQKKHKLKHKSFEMPEPTVDELAELFTLSFFKVITTTPKGTKKNDGWFSGEPQSWKEIAQTVQSIDVNKLPKIISSYIATVIQLFKPFGPLGPLADAPVNPYWKFPYESKNDKYHDDDQYLEDENEYDDD